ncbi:MAG: hypothetical protein PHN51_10155 [Candidatus Nanopelagicales bacterium]|nr:hypothetical protein [Candidatus Nanopelagicales bacterium]
MEVRVVLGKVLALIYRCRILESDDHDDLIKTVLQTVRTDAPGNNFGSVNIVARLKEFCLELVENKDLVVKEVLIPRLQLTLESDAKLLASVRESVETDHSEASTKRIVSSLVKVLHNYYREHQAVLLINKAQYDMTFNRAKVGNFTDYLRNMLGQLEPLATMSTTLKDPAVVSEVDFDLPDEVTKVFEEVRDLNNNTAVYKFGWQAMNRMTQGGVRLGETVYVAALPHRYKTGTTCSMFVDIAVQNVPIIREKDAGKKILLLRISFEDNLTYNLQFMYQYLKAAEGTPVKPDELSNLTASEMSTYIRAQMTRNGFHIKMMRVDPNQWTYSHLCNEIISLEAQGYAIHICMVDYLLLLPTTGCVQGPAGTDKRDLLRRTRNFMSARGIGFITPGQLNTEAKRLMRTLPGHMFLEEIAEKGMYADSSQLDQEIDLEIYVHLFTHKRRKYLSVRRGKHRLATVISEEDKAFILPFAGLNIPILPDIGKPDSSMQTLPKSFGSGETNDFSADLLG